ncbi:MAG: NYN domain-containing protein [Anaerolineaceae bacterium]|nr:NYN domain-containing protein [Anaerolineaceae bacterium]
MSRLAIFIDGNYLMRAAEPVNIDYEKLPKEILGHIDRRTSEPVDLLRTCFYDCLPWQNSDLTGDGAREQARRFQRKTAFFNLLESFPRYSVRQGVLKPRGRERGKPRFEQKRVDVLLALDLATLSFKNQIGHAAVITGDNDFVPAIETARAEGVLVWLFHEEGQHTSNELMQAADERIEIDRDFLHRVSRKKLNVR